MAKRWAARLGIGSLFILWSLNVSAVEPDQVLAKVGEESILVQEFINLAPAMPLFGVQGNVESGKQKLLNNIIRHHLFAQEAVRLDLDQEPAVKAHLQFLIANTLSRAYTQHLAETLIISDEQAKQYFEAHSDNFDGNNFFEVKDEIKDLLKKEAMRNLIDEKEAALRSQKNVIVNEQLLEEIALPTTSQ